jgi:simple sugar transport system permease protein
VTELAAVVAILAAAVRLTVPTLLAAMGEVVSERAGVLNLGLEGMMIVGAFSAYAVQNLTDLWPLSLLSGALAGLVLAALMVLVSVRRGGNQVVAGFALTIAGLGLAGFLNDTFRASIGPVSPMPRYDPMGLSAIPVLGPIFFGQNFIFWVALMVTVGTSFLLRRTHAGLEIRASGLDPWAAAAKGAPVILIRTLAVLAAGFLSGLGGAAISVGALGTFGPGMTAGRGFVAIALVIVGRWSPGWTAMAAFVFGAADALQLRLQSVVDAPTQLLATLPWIVMIFLLILGGKPNQMPQTLGREVLLTR